MLNSANRIILVLSFLVMLPWNAIAQNEEASEGDTSSDTTKVLPKKYWTYAGNYSFNASQVALNENWIGGGKSNVALSTTIDMKLNYNKGDSNWESTLLFEYGRARQGKRPNPFIKTTDNFILITRYGRKVTENLDIKFIGDFRTQIDQGYRYANLPDGAMSRTLISDFMSPGFLLLNMGLSYAKPDKYSITLSPAASKTTFVLVDSLANLGSFGNAPGQRINSEIGGSLIGSYRLKLMENVMFRTNLTLFANYQQMSSLESVDVNWENVLTLTVNKYIKSTVATQLIWDEDIQVGVNEAGLPITGIQFRSSIVIGLAIGLNKKF